MISRQAGISARQIIRPGDPTPIPFRTPATIEIDIRLG
jgi:hypothetical protein